MFIVADGRRVEGERGTRSTDVPLGTSLDKSTGASLFFEPKTGDSSKSPCPKSLPSNEAKSVSLSGGAGAEGEMVAFKGMFIGGRPDFEEPDEEEVRIRVGAVDPPANIGILPPEPP